MNTSPLYLTTLTDQLEAARQLVEAGADVNIRTRDGRTPLFPAAEDGYLDIIDLLVKHGADVSARDANGKTASERALENEQVEAARVLREAQVGESS